jgi:hypothetical protein
MIDIETYISLNIEQNHWNIEQNLRLKYVIWIVNTIILLDFSIS